MEAQLLRSKGNLSWQPEGYLPKGQKPELSMVQPQQTGRLEPTFRTFLMPFFLVNPNIIVIASFLLQMLSHADVLENTHC